MKKIILFLLVPIFTNAQKADSTKLIQKVTGGVIFATVATTTFSGSEVPFSLGYNLMANVSVITSKTFHSVMYGFGNNTIQSINGYFLPKNHDVYVLYIHGLTSKGNYLAVGVEKMMKVDGVKFFVFGELGTNMKGIESFSFGLLTNLQFWKSK
jgi:hypothetical protein